MTRSHSYREKVSHGSNLSENETSPAISGRGDRDKRGHSRRHHRDRENRTDKVVYDSSRKRHRNRSSKSSGLFRDFAMGFLQQLLVLVHIAVDRVLEFVLGQYWGPKATCPPLKSGNEIVTKSAVELARLIREKKLKSYDVVRAYVDRLEAIKKTVNGVASSRYEDALAEAKAIDEQISSGLISAEEFEKKPFLGVPFTTKDSTAVKGLGLTLGLVSRKSVVAKEDAECVRLMKEAGAVIIATSNVPEVNKWIESRNNVFGQTNNPYDLRRSVGGSSGGEAALISACGTAFGLGTDIGGSIRIPAFSCGIFGHKPTEGMVNMKGCTFRTGNETSTMVAAGPMARYATDLKPIFKTLTGPSNAAKLQLDEKVDLKKLKYYYIPDLELATASPVSKELQATMKKVREHIAELTGESPALSKLPCTNLASRMWRYWMTQEPSDFNKLLGDGAALNPFVELAKKLTGQSQFTMAAVYSLVDSILPRENGKLIREATEKCENALTELLGDDGVLLFHSSPRTAPFHYYPLFKYPDFHYFSIFNVLRVPVTQVPMGLGSNGLPLGIQVVAGKNCDRYCLAVAEELERAFGGWVPPFSN